MYVCYVHNVCSIAQVHQISFSLLNIRLIYHLAILFSILNLQRINKVWNLNFRDVVAQQAADSFLKAKRALVMNKLVEEKMEMQNLQCRVCYNHLSY